MKVITAPIRRIIISLAACSCFPLSSSLTAQPLPCTPVAFLFRHAEDYDGTPQNPINPPFNKDLTPAGYRHADIYGHYRYGFYEGMVNDYSIYKNYCKVSRVYAMYDYNKDGGPGTPNPRLTATPLSAGCCFQSPLMEVDVVVVNKTKKYPLYEHVSEEGDGGLDEGRLLEAITPILNSGNSIAIFWTRQGMGDVAKALLENNQTLIPIILPNISDLRSSVNIFKWSAQEMFTEFSSTGKNKLSKIQCFNVNPDTGFLTVDPRRFNCMKSGFINKNNNMSDYALTNLKGHICETAIPAASDPNSDIEGYCIQP